MSLHNGPFLEVRLYFNNLKNNAPVYFSDFIGPILGPLLHLSTPGVWYCSYVKIRYSYDTNQYNAIFLLLLHFQLCVANAIQFYLTRAPAGRSGYTKPSHYVRPKSKKNQKKKYKKNHPLKSRNINEYIYSTNSRPDRIKKRSQKKYKKNHPLNLGISMNIYRVSQKKCSHVYFASLYNFF